MRRHCRLQGESEPETLAAICERAGKTIREVLDKAAMLVNHGGVVETDAVQEQIDRLFSRLTSITSRRDPAPTFCRKPPP